MKTFKKTFKFTALMGIVIGFVNGLFGAGGGSLLVPALQKFKRYETHQAHGTTVAVILPLSIVSAVVYITGVDVAWDAVLWVSLGGVAGGIIGAKLLNRLAGKWLHVLFGAFLAAGALRMLWS